MKLLLVLCACVALACAKQQNAERDRRFLLSTFQSAFEAVKDFTSTAVDKVEGAAHTVGNAIVDAANTVKDGVVDAAHAVGNFVTDAADSVVSAAARAKALLGPILDQVAQTVGPVAEQLGKAALNKLIEVAPQLLAQLGEAALQEIVTSVVAGKRDVSVDHVAHLFRQIVEGEVNATVGNVHRVLDAVDQFNGKLKYQVQSLERSIKAGQDPRLVASQFIHTTVLSLQHLIETNATDVDLDHLSRLVHESIDLFGKKLRTALRTSVLEHHRKRALQGLFPNPLTLVQDFLTVLHQGEQAVEHLVADLHQLAQGLLQPTVENVKQIAQTLLDNAGTVTAELMSTALTALAPFQQVLGPLFQQVATLAHSLGVPALPLVG